MNQFERWLSLALVVVAAGYHWYRHDEPSSVFCLLLAIWMNTRKAA